MPSMSGMLMSIRTTSGLSRAAISSASRARRRRADDLDVALEAEQLREVVAGLGDVVDDEDADLVGHLALLGPGSRWSGWSVSRRSGPGWPGAVAPVARLIATARVWASQSVRAG